MTRRWMPVLTCSLVTAFFGGFAFGSPMTSLLLVGPAVTLVAYGGLARRRSATPEDRWTPATEHPGVRPDPSSRHAVARALARVESRELAISPWFGVGVGFLLVIFIALAIVFAEDNGEVWRQTFGLSPWFAHPLAGMTIVAVHRAVTRPARDATDELFDTCPTSRAVRVEAVLRTFVVPVAAFCVFLLVYGAAIFLRSPQMHGPVTPEVLPVLLAGPVLIAGAVFLGAALGSWLRFGLAPVAGVVGVGVLSLRLATAGDSGWNGVSVLSTVGPQDDSPLVQPIRSAWPYLAWLIGLAMVVMVIALLKDRRDRPVWSIGVAGVVLATIAAGVSLRPIDADAAAELADKVARPAAHQSCESPRRTRVEVCTFDGYGEMRERTVAALGPVAAALPDDISPITVRQAFEGTRSELPPGARRLLEDGVPLAGADEIFIGFSAGREALLDFRLRVAFHALGRPLTAHAGARPSTFAVDGQARGVVALWLAARGLSVEHGRRLASAASSGSDSFERGLAWPGGCGPIVWSPQDLAAARSLMAMSEDDVGAVVAGDFDRWSDPATDTDDLLDELGLPPGGPYDRIVLRHEAYC